MRELTNAELQVVSGGFRSVIERPRHPILAVIIAAIVRAIRGPAIA